MRFSVPFFGLVASLLSTALAYEQWSAYKIPVDESPAENSPDSEWNAEEWTAKLYATNDCSGDPIGDGVTAPTRGPSSIGKVIDVVDGVASVWLPEPPDGESWRTYRGRAVHYACEGTQLGARHAGGCQPVRSAGGGGPDVGCIMPSRGIHAR
ncbi:Uu.00g101510.m01.CDS01 [Anthostomella pinea]|uniref:Uu.00g101510.m01.CDS01 n=1 Tax=Anthostomella pinea TaxID=933095 RepID=A0AAI8YFB8_9PEZI|nr:Uu.00g101510.m01.CDS01 [Anthostomella pinea]